MTIGFYDSGIGGLTVLKEAISKMPKGDYIFYGDNANVPYGTKTRDEIIAFAREAVAFLVRNGAECVVIACNTATSAAGEVLRTEFDIPIICMEPAINLAMKQNSENKKILVLATPLTLKLEKYNALKNKLGAHFVDELPMPKLVDFAENMTFCGDAVENYLHTQFEKINFFEYAFVVLGCTHFSYFTETLREILPAHIKILDGNIGTVNHLFATIGAENAVGNGKVDFHFTGSAPEIKEILRLLQ